MNSRFDREIIPLTSRYLMMVLALASSSTLCACATIVTGNRQTIKVDSNPQGAKVYTAVKTTEKGNDYFSDKSEAGVTPITVIIERKDGAILVEKEGYAQSEVALKRRMNSWVLGDVALLSLLSTSIDTSTGASNEYDPSEFMIELKPLPK